jgi:hypothetical protein
MEKSALLSLGKLATSIRYEATGKVKEIYYFSFLFHNDRLALDSDASNKWRIANLIGKIATMWQSNPHRLPEATQFENFRLTRDLPFDCAQDRRVAHTVRSSSTRFGGFAKSLVCYTPRSWEKVRGRLSRRARVELNRGKRSAEFKPMHYPIASAVAISDHFANTGLLIFRGTGRKPGGTRVWPKQNWTS